MKDVPDDIRTFEIHPLKSELEPSPLFLVLSLQNWGSLQHKAWSAKETELHVGSLEKGSRGQAEEQVCGMSSPSLVKPKDLRYLMIILGTYIPQKKSSAERPVSLQVLFFPVIPAIHSERMAVFSAI